MKPAFFRPEHPERADALRAEAHRWLGTPFFANGDTCGRGVSCQKLVGGIYKAVWRDIEVPDVPMAHSRFSQRPEDSLVEQFMANRTDFEQCGIILGVTGTVEPGDLLGFRFGQVVHHLGISLGVEFIHCLDPAGARYSLLTDATWLSRLARIWRPLEESTSSTPSTKST